MKINYWDSSSEIYVEIKDGYDEIGITIRNGDFEIEISGQFERDSCYYIIGLYEVCALIALWHEVYGPERKMK